MLKTDSAMFTTEFGTCTPCTGAQGHLGRARTINNFKVFKISRKGQGKRHTGGASPFESR